jgi:phosphatidylinositol alpha-mannosyltransferase
MKILQVTQSYHPRPGGVTEHVHHVATELRARGHDVAVVTANFGRSNGDHDGVIRVGRNMLVPINGAWVNMTIAHRLVTQLAQIFKTLRPDVIHTHCPLAPTLPLAALDAAPAGTLTVGTFHAAATSSLGYRIFQKPLQRYWNRLDVRIAVSEAARVLADTYFPGDYTIVPNGVDTNRFSPHVRAIDGLRDSAFNVLFVGRLDKRKGLKYLFHAVRAVHNLNGRRIRIIVVGDDGLRRFNLPQLPRAVDVVFAGVVPNSDLPRYFASGDVFCSPATGQESFGIVLLEAMASGIPVIGTSIPGYLTILRDEWNALVVPPRDPGALCEAIGRVIRDRTLRQRIAANGIATARRYRWAHVVDHLESLYGAPTGVRERIEA